MEIYVQSAGNSQEQDYFWQKITNNRQEQVREPELINSFKNLLQTQAYSLFLGRKYNKLILLITGMKATIRQDYRGRTIRNSIALIAEDNQDNEQKIRGIAVLALEEKLENKIDSAIKSGGQYGFEVDYDKIDNTIKEFLQPSSPTVTTRVMIGKNLKENRDIIADELTRCLPEKKKPSEALVVVTGIKAEDTLKEAGVWRGLSNLVEKANLGNYELPSQLQKNFQPDNKITKIHPRLIIALITLFGTIWLMVLQFPRFIGKNNSQPTPIAVAAINQGGQYFVTTNPHGKLLMHNTQDTTNNIIAKNNAQVKSVAISSNGNYIVYGDDNGNVQLWDVTNEKKIKIIINSDKNVNFKHEKAVLSLGINSYQKKIKIVSGGADGQVLLWEINVNNGEGYANITKLF